MVRWPSITKLSSTGLFRSASHGALILASITGAWAAPLAEPPELAQDASPLSRYSFSEAHLGTVVRLVLFCSDRELALEQSERCFEQVRLYDLVFSDYKVESELMRLCQVAHLEPTPVSNDLLEVLACAHLVSAQTEGAFDITMGASTKAWRNKKAGEPEESAVSKEKGTYRDLVLDRQESSVSFRKRLHLDLGGIAKGYIADQLASTIQAAGITSFAVMVGGEIVVNAAPPDKAGWTIELEGPDQRIQESLVLSQTSLSTSGDSYQFIERDGERSAHIIDPATGAGKQDHYNVTVSAPSAMLADAWATALRVLGPDKGLPLLPDNNTIQACFTYSNRLARKSKGFPATPMENHSGE